MAASHQPNGNAPSVIRIQLEPKFGPLGFSDRGGDLVQKAAFETDPAQIKMEYIHPKGGHQKEVVEEGGGGDADGMGGRVTQG